MPHTHEWLGLAKRMREKIMTPFTDRQQTMIVNNLVKACQNIEDLKPIGFGYINVANGFIAHYNIDGFKNRYRYFSLKSEIIKNAKQNRFANFNKEDKNYEYYQAKAAIYSKVVEKLKC